MFDTNSSLGVMCCDLMLRCNVILIRINCVDFVIMDVHTSISLERLCDVI